MDFGLTLEQQRLRDDLRAFFKAEWPIDSALDLEERDAAHSPDLWRKLAQRRLLGLGFPKEFGGEGMDFVALTVFFEECGRAVAPSSVFSTVGLAGLAILQAGNAAQKGALLSAIAKGDLVSTVAAEERDRILSSTGVTLAARARADGYTLTGEKAFVRNARDADVIVVAARTAKARGAEDGVTLLLVGKDASGLSFEPLPTFYPHGYCAVRFSSVKAPKSDVLGPVGNGWPMLARALELATILQCAEMLGGAQEAFERSVEYSKIRVQFGRPIGSFQAIQHYAANMITDIDGARFLTYQAAWRASRGLPCTRETAMAKHKASQCYVRTTNQAHQIHGGIGFYSDFNLHHYFKKAKMLEVELGGPDDALERVAQALEL